MIRWTTPISIQMTWLDNVVTSFCCSIVLLCFVSWQLIFWDDSHDFLRLVNKHSLSYHKIFQLNPSFYIIDKGVNRPWNTPFLYYYFFLIKNHYFYVITLLWYTFMCLHISLTCFMCQYGIYSNPLSSIRIM